MSNTISGLSRPRPLDEPSPAPAPARPSRELSRPPAIDRRSDALLAQFVGNATGARASGARPASARRTNDQILYVGVNPDSSRIEASALRRLRADTRIITAIAGDVVVEGGRSFDLSSAEGRGAFCASMGLHGDVANAVALVLEKTQAGTRAVIGQVALRWSVAERGEAVPSRLLLSGHSWGAHVGGGETKLTFTDLHALAKAMPLAADQIEDVHISGCFSSRNAREQTRWRAAFPNMKTLWAYDEYAPAAPVDHFATWEASTRGRNERLTPAPWLRDRSVVTWSTKNGYVDKELTPEALERAKRAADRAFDDLMAGTPRTRGPREEPAASHYSAYRLLSNRPERDDNARMEMRADQLMAIRNYEPTIRGNFARTYATQIAAGYQALGLEAPAFEELTRAEALSETRKLRAAIADRERSGDGVTDPVPAATRTLEPILRGLDTFAREIIEPDWNTHSAPVPVP